MVFSDHYVCNVEPGSDPIIDISVPPPLLSISPALTSLRRSHHLPPSPPIVSSLWKPRDHLRSSQHASISRLQIEYLYPAGLGFPSLSVIPPPRLAHPSHPQFQGNTLERDLTPFIAFGVCLLLRLCYVFTQMYISDHALFCGFGAYLLLFLRLDFSSCGDQTGISCHLPKILPRPCSMCLLQAGRFKAFVQVPCLSSAGECGTWLSLLQACSCQPQPGKRPKLPSCLFKAAVFYKERSSNPLHLL